MKTGINKGIICFLDFDGVFHHFFPKENSDGNEYFAYAPLFEQTILELMQDYDIKIVFSTSWRYSHSLDSLKSNFKSDVVRDAMIGSTPLLKHEVGTLYQREKEILQYLKDNNITDPWVALDDFEDYFGPLSEGHFVFCDNQFKEPEAERLKTTIKNLIC